MKIIEKYLDAKINAGKATAAIRRVSNHHKPIKHRRKYKSSFKSENRVAVVKRVGSTVPIYATINKPKNKERRASFHKKETNDATYSHNFLPPTLSESFRKTSFDSTCTINSVDSGFIEMQSKAVLRNNIESGALNTIQIKVEKPREHQESNELITEPQDQDSLKLILESPSSWNRLTVPQQSRNRRKSYEEFKSLFCDLKSNSTNNVDVKSLSKSRRKSYEEFKSVTNVICDNTSDLTTIKNDLKSPDCMEDNSSSNNFFSRLRRGSKRFSQKNNSKNSSSKKVNQDMDVKSMNFNNTIYDILRRSRKVEKNSIIDISKRKQINYDKNLEIFESHCNNENSHKRNNTIYNKSSVNDNFKSCGTIYDIIQNRSDITYIKGRYSKKYDKYMTYGTLYEILHRKSDEGEQFDRKRTFSEKFTNKQCSDYGKTSQKSTSSSSYSTPSSMKKSTMLSLENNQTVGNVTDTNSRNLNSSNSSGSLKQGSFIANNQLSITSVNGKQLSTIYDILQTKKLDTTAVGTIFPLQTTHLPSNKNRFLVRKITEEELFELQKEETKEECNKSDLNQENTKIVLNSESDEFALMTNKKQTKLRRFSNILSYSPNKISNVNAESVELNSLESSEIKCNNTTQKLSTTSIDDIYSRLNRTHFKQLENFPIIINQFNTRERTFIENKVVIYKSNSVDNILNASKKEETQETFIRHRQPLRKISVPTHLPPKVLPKKSTRRLSEFTRGEFLNEKL